MRKFVIAAGAVAAVAFGGAAVAQTSPAAFQQGPVYYGNLGYSQLDQSDGDLGAITGRFGAKFNPNFGVEGEVSVGVKDDDFRIGTVDGSIKHEYDAAAYVVGTLPINDQFELFARGGYGTTKIKAEAGGLSREADGTSWNYGAGANFYFDAENGVRGDWTRRDFTDSDAGEVDVYSLSYVRRF
ncbi:porin family protein [Brevundimonas pishanensis]|uniref:porin family protein n=1 Tax=Brevundimonas pishanensis TaxID=2896315 RepID=UPI001FA73EB3|nr:porin family protein [Brevundimonas pishanensis]